MNSLRIRLPVLLALIGIAGGAALHAQSVRTNTSGAAAIIRINGPIGPATAEYVSQGLEKAARQQARVAILELDTPGGLSSSMRTIIQAVLASDIPVIGYVAPQGARAASAGTYILYATHVAAMAPATNLGAATPVPIMGSEAAPSEGSGGSQTSQPQLTAEQRKVLNDSVAYIKALAQRRGRNAEWAEKAVRKAASLTAEAALKKHVIDVIAPSLTALLKKVDGKTVTVHNEPVVLHTAGIPSYTIEPSWRIRLLSVLSNPTLAYLLFLGGLAGLAIEATHPGAIFPGVAGAICLIFALFAFQILPVNFAGLGLMLLGIGLMVAEALVTSFGALGIGGVVAFVIGSILLMDTNAPGFTIQLSVIAGASGTVGVGLLLLIIFAVKTHRRAIHSGREQMIGATALAIEDFVHEGQVRIHGEIWRARSEQPVEKAQALRVVRMRNLTLDVEAIDETE